MGNQFKIKCLQDSAPWTATIHPLNHMQRSSANSLTIEVAPLTSTVTSLEVSVSMTSLTEATSSLANSSNSLAPWIATIHPLTNMQRSSANSLTIEVAPLTSTVTSLEVSVSMTSLTEAILFLDYSEM